ncbi:MAG: methyltransferase family protein, partial [Micromonosporaceae bacterium]
WLGWALLWGPLPVLVRRWLPVPVALTGLLWLDLVTMPVLHPVLRLGPDWWLGELIGLAAVALPAILLGRWVADGDHLVARTALQLVTFAGLTLWLLPAVAIAAGDGSWTHLVGAPRWQLSLLMQVAALVSVPGVLAVREFVERGGGTPYPWDPPRRLVTTGPYAYLANPMQLSGVLLLLVVAGATRSWAVAATALAAAAFGGFVAGPHEHQQLTAQYGAAWLAYRTRVRLWWPRWRPYRRGGAELYLARECQLCESTRVWLASHNPTDLVVRPAPGQLRRARYRHAGYVVDGVAAVARAMEHANLWWAYAGWLLRLPLLDRFVRLFADGLGAGPRTVTAPGRGREHAPR